MVRLSLHIAVAEIIEIASAEIKKDIFRPLIIRIGTEIIQMGCSITQPLILVAN